MRPSQATPAAAGTPARWRRPATALAALTLATLTAGCHLPGTSSGSGSTPNSLTVAVVPGIDNAPLYLAKQEGLFARAGLRLTIMHVRSDSQAIADLSSGK